MAKASGSSVEVRHGTSIGRWRGRQDEGWYHGVEVLPGLLPEVEESAGKWRRCTKNPSHRTFIPISDFTIDHFPPITGKQEFFKHIKKFADLTVRLRVNYTSKKRRDDDAFHELRGTHAIRCGSGWVRGVSRGKGPCPSSTVGTDGSSPNQEWFEIHVTTARHVVYNKEEAISTKVNFL